MPRTAFLIINQGGHPVYHDSNRDQICQSVSLQLHAIWEQMRTNLGQPAESPCFRSVSIGSQTAVMLMLDGYQALVVSDDPRNTKRLLEQQAALACRLLKLVVGTTAYKNKARTNKNLFSHIPRLEPLLSTAAVLSHTQPAVLVQATDRVQLGQLGDATVAQLEAELEAACKKHVPDAFQAILLARGRLVAEWNDANEGKVHPDDRVLLNIVRAAKNRTQHYRILRASQQHGARTESAREALKLELFPRNADAQNYGGGGEGDTPRPRVNDATQLVQDKFQAVTTDCGEAWHARLSIRDDQSPTESDVSDQSEMYSARSQPSTGSNSAASDDAAGESVEDEEEDAYDGWEETELASLYADRIDDVPHETHFIETVHLHLNPNVAVDRQHTTQCDALFYHGTALRPHENGTAKSGCHRSSGWATDQQLCLVLLARRYSTKVAPGSFGKKAVPREEAMAAAQRIASDLCRSGLVEYVALRATEHVEMKHYHQSFPGLAHFLLIDRTKQLFFSPRLCRPRIQPASSVGLAASEPTMQQFVWEAYCNLASVFEQGHNLVIARPRQPSDSSILGSLPGVQYGGWSWTDETGTAGGRQSSGGRIARLMGSFNRAWPTDGGVFDTPSKGSGARSAGESISPLMPSSAKKLDRTDRLAGSSDAVESNRSWELYTVMLGGLSLEAAELMMDRLVDSCRELLE